jgi:H+/gluconate symporter-like permease
MEISVYKKLFWGIFFLIAAIVAIAMFYVSVMFIFIPVINMLWTNPYAKLVLLSIICCIGLILLKSVKTDK